MSRRTSRALGLAWSTTKLLGRVGTRAVMVAFGAMNAMDGRGNPVEPPSDALYRPPREPYRP